MTPLYISLLAVIVPALVTSLTGWLKLLPTFASLASSSRTPAVRTLAAALALVSVILTEWVTGTFDANALAAILQTLLLAGGTWVASLGIFHGIFQSTPVAPLGTGSGTIVGNTTAPSA